MHLSGDNLRDLLDSMVSGARYTANGLSRETANDILEAFGLEPLEQEFNVTVEYKFTTLVTFTVRAVSEDAAIDKAWDIAERMKFTTTTLISYQDAPSGADDVDYSFERGVVFEEEDIDSNDLEVQVTEA